MVFPGQYQWYAKGIHWYKSAMPKIRKTTRGSFFFAAEKFAQIIPITLPNKNAYNSLIFCYKLNMNIFITLSRKIFILVKFVKKKNIFMHVHRLAFVSGVPRPLKLSMNQFLTNPCSESKVI